jgi:sugar fermentation stimulation protein A
MKYRNIILGKFIDRPNRFIANVDIDGCVKTVHVKNTGRCKELLLPEARVVLEKSDNPNRKTAYDLIAVYKEKLGWVNIDSQAPNKVAGEWLETRGFDYVKPECKYGDSRIDFYMEKGNDKYLMEVKGCTLEIDGQGYFPDAPTTRGVRHIYELINAVKEGYKAVLLFVIQMEKVESVLPYAMTDKAFEKAYNEAKENGVMIKFLKCKVKEDELAFHEINEV